MLLSERLGVGQSEVLTQCPIDSKVVAFVLVWPSQQGGMPLPPAPVRGAASVGSSMSSSRAANSVNEEGGAGHDQAT